MTEFLFNFFALDFSEYVRNIAYHGEGNSEEENEVYNADRGLESHACCFKTDYMEANETADGYNCVAFK